MRSSARLTPNGTWVLRFEDGWGGDAGEVTGAELFLPPAGITRTVSNNNDSGPGSGITNFGGDLTLLRSTVVGNSATFIAGVRSRSNVEGLVSTTLIDNSTISAQSGGDLVGLGVIAQQQTHSSLVLRNSTLTDTDGEPASGLELRTEATGSTISARISNSLFATGGPTISRIVLIGGTPPAITSAGFNLATDDANGFLTRLSDLLNANAPMQLLQNHGGGIPVHRPLLTSDALDNGRATGPRLSDQTGIFDRVTDLNDNQYPNAPGGDGSDIGAFELPVTPVDVIFADRME